MIWILFFSLFVSIPAETYGQTPTEDETSAEIGRLKSEIQRIQEENEKQIQELKKRIEDLEAKNKGLKEYEEPSKLPEKEEESSATTFVTEWWRNIEVGYSNGFFFSTQDGLFSLKTDFRSQFRFSVDDREGDTDTGFDIPRLWITFRGNAFRPWLKYLLILEASGDVELLDYSIDLARFIQAVPRFGQYRVPFNREELTDPFNLQFVDTSILNQEFRLGRDVGASIGGVLSRFFTYSLGVFNGNGRDSLSENSNLLYVGRVMFTPTGEPRYSSINPFPVSGDYTYSQGTFGNPQIPLIALSAAMAYLPGFKPAEKSPDNAFINDRVTALGSAESDIFQFSADLTIKYLIFSFEAEYDLRNINPEETGIDSVLAQGIRVQSGVFLIPKFVEVAGRFVLIGLDNDSGDDKIWEVTPGLSFYFTKNHNMKLQFDYSFIRNELIDIDTNRFRTQFTVSF
ncbi:MAG: TMF family protein [Deltaproteobacteria bacterium]|nr:TMF family protein [Deltaproteobacteria bacterium]